MNICYIFDDGFVLPAAVSIYSLMYNNSHIDNIDFFILDDGISEKNKDLFKRMISDFNRKVYFFPVKDIKNKLALITKYNWNGSYSTYIRLMLNSIFPDRNDKIIMIDADTIIVGKIDELKDFDLGDNPCATALEAMPISYYKNSGLGMNKLINGGLFIIDLAKWREIEAEKKILDYLVNIRDKNMLTDEDVISVLFKDNISIIPPRYNCLAQYYFYASPFYYSFFGWNELNKNNAYYSLDELEEAKDNPVILHCIDCHTNRPWHKINNHPYSKIFDEYLNMTPWRRVNKIDKHMGLVSKIEYFLKNSLPPAFSNFYYAVVLRIYYGFGAKRYYRNLNK